MTNPLLGLWRSVFPPLEEYTAQIRDRSSYERFALPFTFKPRLSLWEALLAVSVTFLRIVLGSVLFGYCGAYAISTYQAVNGWFWRGCIVALAFLLFLLLLGALMAGISAVVRLVLPGRDARKNAES